MSVKEIWADEVVSRLHDNGYCGSFDIHVEKTEDTNQLIHHLQEKYRLGNIMNFRSNGGYFANRNHFNFLDVIKKMLVDPSVPSSWIENIISSSLTLDYPEFKEKKILILELVSLKESDNFDEDFLMWRLSK